MSDISGALNAYKDFLKAAEDQHKKTIAQAQAQLEVLIAETERNGKEENSAQTAQSVWIDDSKGERLLLLNEPAVDQINRLFSGFQEVIELMRKRETGQAVK